MSNDRIKANQDVESIERVLTSYSLTAPQIDRDRLMFLAGQASTLASGHRQDPGQSETTENFVTGKLTRPARRVEGGVAHWLWPASTAAFAATSLALAVALISRPLSQPQVVYIERSEAVEPRGSIETSPAVASLSVSAAGPKVESTMPTDNYLRTREVALRMGLDAIGAPSASAAEPRVAPTYGSFLHELDAAPANTLEAAPWLESLFNL